MALQSSRSDKNIDFRRRIYIFIGFPAGFFLFFIVVLFSLQIIQGSRYAQQARKNREQYSILPAIRGVIYDRTHEHVLAYNKRSFMVTIVPQNLPKDKEEREGLLDRLGILLDMPKDDIIAAIGRKGRSIYGSYVVKTEVPFKDIVFLAEHNRDFPGVYWKSKPMRVYPYRETLSHVVGYVGMISEKELFELSDRGYNIESGIGKSGVEKVYDMDLKGRDGYVRRIVDVTNQVTAEIIDKGAVPSPGNNVVLTIDIELQRLAEQALGNNPGAVVISRPATGEVLALASYPRFDPNMFILQAGKDTFKKLALDTRKPFLNRAIQAQYPAGSIFKLVVALALLESEKIPPEREFTCGGGYQTGNRFFACWKNHGKVDLHKAIVDSCDSYFYQTALILGPDTIADFAKQLGLGEDMGLDLGGEANGLIPDIQWKRDIKGDIWYDGDTLNLAIGQGFLLVTPLQINCLTNLLANNGVLMRPYLVKEIRSARNDELVYQRIPEVHIDTNIDVKYFHMIIDAMHGVVTEGTAKWGGAVLSTEMAAKTSTSEVLGAETHSWFTALAPYGSSNENELITVTAIIEHGGAGSEVAAPVVSEIIEAYFGHCDLETARRNIWKKKQQIALRERKASGQSE